MTTDFKLGDWIVRPQRRVIERNGESVHIKPKPMAVLECLATANGESVSRNQLFDTVWPGGVVSDDTLTKCIVELRKAFGDTARESGVIETIPKMGFRLVLPVDPTAVQPGSQPDPQGSETPHTSPGTVTRGRRVVIAALLLIAVVLSFQGAGLWQGETITTPDPVAEVQDYAPQQLRGIAVLPFVNMSKDPDNEYFSDGISEELLNTLAKGNRFPVIARTSSFRFKGQNRDAKEIGHLLGVTHLLEGSVRKANGEVRVIAQLIDATTGLHLWTQAYQQEMNNIFALQLEISKDIAEQVELALGDSLSKDVNIAPVATGGTRNPDAYNLYIKGMQLLSSSNPVPREQSVAYFEQAIALDKDYADAWAGKGRALFALGQSYYGHRHIPATVYPEAIAAFRRALEIEPRHAFAMGWLGMSLIRNDFKWVEGLELLKQSVELNPGDAAMLSNYGNYLHRIHIDGSEAIMDRAFRLDPFGLWPITIRANSLFRRGSPVDGWRVMETSLVGDPDGYAPNALSAAFSLAIGMNDRAREHIRRARRVAHPDDFCLDMMQGAADYIPGTDSSHLWDEIWSRAKTEHACEIGPYANVAARAGNLGVDGETQLRALELMIEQRQSTLADILFRGKPQQISEADWQRMKEITGVAEFQARKNL